MVNVLWALAKGAGLCVMGLALVGVLFAALIIGIEFGWLQRVVRWFARK